MKNLSLFFILSILFSSCYNYYSSSFRNYEDGVKSSQFTSIPIKRSVEKVKVIFPGEKVPEEPYIKVDVIDAFGNAQTSTQYLISRLQNQAKAIGVDAIIIISKDNISEIFQDEYCEDYTVTTQKISALGIKFIKNIDYLEECIKGGTILIWDENKNELVEKSKFKSDWKGNLVQLESGDKFYYDFLYNFSLQHLAYEQTTSWTYKVSNPSPSEKIIRRSKNDPSDRLPYAKEVKLKEVYGKIVFADIKSFYNQIYSGKLNLQYDKNDRIIKKSIRSKTLGEFQQKFIYNENGTLSVIEVFDMKKATPKLYLKVVFENYRQSDLVQLLDEDQR
ncbi:MAG: hypothetical protein AB8F94_29705 [Saprospiraceae bacterium]